MPSSSLGSRAAGRCPELSTVEFIRGLEDLGYLPREEDGLPVVFDYIVECGPLLGRVVRLAFQNLDAFPGSCPTGPCVSPRILPICQVANTPAPHGGVHPLNPPLDPGGTWEYWSRPYSGWRASLGVQEYMEHVRDLFLKLPDHVA